MAAIDDLSAETQERRRSSDRRSQTLRALVTGGWHGRRRNARRAELLRPGDIDWHAPHWFAAALLVLLLSMADTLLTLVLVQHGAIVKRLVGRQNFGDLERELKPWLD